MAACNITQHPKIQNIEENTYNNPNLRAIANIYELELDEITLLPISHESLPNYYILMLSYTNKCKLSL